MFGRARSARPSHSQGRPAASTRRTSGKSRLARKLGTITLHRFVYPRARGRKQSNYLVVCTLHIACPRETETGEGHACSRRSPFGDMLPSNGQMHSSVKPPACDASVVEVSVVIHWRSVDQLVPFWAGFTFARSAGRTTDMSAVRMKRLSPCYTICTVYCVGDSNITCGAEGEAPEFQSYRSISKFRGAKSSQSNT